MTRRLIAGALCAGLLCASGGTRALADGAASTRNIIFGAAAAGVGTWAIINHNKKVHQKEAEKDAQIAALERQQAGTAAWYGSSHAAYLHELAVAHHYEAETAALKREVAHQHVEVVRLRTQLAQAGPPAPQRRVALRPLAAVAAAPPPAPVAEHLAPVSYGWGQL